MNKPIEPLDLLAAVTSAQPIETQPEDPDAPFDWSADEEDVIIKSQPAIACYWNPRGEVVIRREGSKYEDDHFVFVQVEHLDTLITRLKEMRADGGSRGTDRD
jgi:hypothetical protein